jgi:transposase-like protein
VGTTVVAGMVERGGRVRTKKIPTPSKQVLVGLVQDNVHPIATVMTDELAAYESLDKIVKEHHVVNHSAEEWVRGDVHTNNIEGVWSLLKRGIVGSFHKISVKHLDRYLAEFDYRFNNRKNDSIFDLTVGGSARNRECRTRSLPGRFRRNRFRLRLRPLYHLPGLLWPSFYFFALYRCRADQAIQQRIELLLINLHLLNDTSSGKLHNCCGINSS